MKTFFPNLCLRKTFRRDSWLRRAVALLATFSFTLNVLANPTGLTVTTGTAVAQQAGSQLNITTSQNAFLNWQSFNIAAGERTVFNQPNAYSVVVNQINGQSASQIYGSLQANGIVVLMNSSGFYFGPNSFVSAAGLVVSTANCLPPQNGGGTWEFNGPPPLASIVNYGSIKVGNGGSAYLIADKIENYGNIEAPGGSIGLTAGQTVTLSERPDGRGMSMQVTLPQGSVNNYGNLIADAGTIALNAKVVNQGGFIQANSVQNQNGVIELVASDSLSLAANSQIVAAGDDSAGGSAGGSVTLKSGNSFSDVSGSQISVAGGANGGNGGALEISAPSMSALHTKIDGHAQAGSAGGKLLLDPDYIVLNQSGSDNVNVSGSSGHLNVNDSPGGTLFLNVGNSGSGYADSAFVGLSQITLQAKYDLTLVDGTAWRLSDSTGQSSGQLNLEAGRNIYLGDNSTGSAVSIYDSKAWSIGLYAGVSDFSLLKVTPGGGSIYLDSSDPFNPSFVQTAQGSVNLVAGQDIKVGFGYVNTTAGGSVSAHALAGNIDTGGYAQGYIFQPGSSAGEGYYIDSARGVGGISTTAGGDVNLIAGGDVRSLLPGKDGYYYDDNFIAYAGNSDITTAGSGAYGSGSGQLGNVNIVAGGNVTGNYLVANGVGKIFAGVTMDANGNPVKNAAGSYVLDGTGSAGTDSSYPNLALNLIKGGWDVTAAQNIFLQEVRNPNGDFNVNSGGAFHAFDYAPSDYVNLTAGNLVQLGASSSALPRLNNLDSLKVPVIYPGILNIVAGAGGVVLTGDSSYNQLILFPSPQGSLTIITTDAGALTGNLPTINGAPQIFNLIVSDSGHKQYDQSSGGLFGLNDHAATPIHAGSATPIDLNISGNMSLILLGVPEAAQINVVGNMNNCRFQGMNLNAADVTSITVGQDAKINMENSGILNHTTDGGLTVGGDIYNRGVFTSIDLSQVAGAQAPDLSLLSRAVTTSRDPSVTTLLSSIYYNPTTKILTYQNIPGRSLASVLHLLQNLTVQAYVNGVPQWQDPPFNTIPKPAPNTVSLLDNPTAQALLAKYNSLGAIPTSAGGYTIGGGGKFEISANNIDLGTTAGIQSKGAGLYTVGNSYPLASLFGAGGVFQNGTSIDIRAAGNLDMFSSSIATLNGGNISIKAGGHVYVGSSDFSVNTLGIRGIYTSGQGDVSVIAGGDININGSRIASYDGGNLTVESLNGNIDAGEGAASPVTVQGYYEDPITHRVYQNSPQLPFSGIVSLTFPPRNPNYPAPPATLGNILVEAPNGNVSANVSGILQIALNNLSYPAALVRVLAGYELRDSGGNPVSAANMASGTAVLALSAQNLVTDQTLAGSGNRLQLVDKNGVASLDARGNPIYVTQLVDGNADTVFTDNSSISSGNLSKTLSERQLRLKLVGAGGQALLDAGGNPIYVTQVTDANSGLSFVIGRNINANGSGIIASNARLDATGDINGLIFARNNIDIVAQQNVNVTALGEGSVSVGAGGSVSGTIIGVGGVSASGGSIDASLVSANVSGATSGQSGLGSGGAANATSTAASASDDSAKTAQKSDATGEDDLLKKKGKGIALAQKVSRVTVLLPQKN